jgi:hypothetical protein
LELFDCLDPQLESGPEEVALPLPHLKEPEEEYRE